MPFGVYVRKTKPLAERLWAKVERRGPAECWPWRGCLNNRGYGYLFHSRQAGETSSRRILAYVAAWESVNGPVPAGLVLDHTCRVRGCANPAHLEPVTNRENILRGTSPSAGFARNDRCCRGHLYTPENTTVYRGARRCRACQKAHNDVINARVREKRLEAR